MIDLSYISGTITHDDLTNLDSRILSEQIEDLKEDMLQVEYTNNLILDVGWYPSFDASGHFQIKIIKSCQWDDPSFSSTAQTISDLNIELHKAQKFIENI